MLEKLRLAGQIGDTIVEVMIVLAVLGLALSISYATASHSLLNARQAQENSTATELVQSQIENLRALSVNDSTSPNYIYRTGTFCVDASGNIQASPCVNGLYTVSDSWSNSTADLFTAKAIWDDVLGQGTDSVTLIYQVHQ